MCLEIPRAEPLDREVVNADEPHAARDERARRARLDVGEVLAEAASRVVPEGGVAGLEEHARTASERGLPDVPLPDGARARGDGDDARLAHEGVERERDDAGRALYEVRGRVNVRARVRAEAERRDVGGVAALNCRPRSDLDA